jgi:deferrochelatase/peroxidase EfeB
MPTPPSLSRRAFLTGSAAVGVAAVAGGVGGVALATAAEGRAPAVAVPTYVPFDGAHQAGIVSPTRAQAAAIFVALDVVVTSKPELVTALAELTGRARNLTGGWSPEAGDPLYPPPDSGILGASVGPADLTMTVGFGASLFDERFGLGDRLPRQLTRMPSFPNDRLVPALSHGDLMLQICGTDEASCVHALRYVMAGTRGSLVVRWLLHGFQHRPGGTTVANGTQATPRNLLGFKDGTANPAMTDESLMDELVWVGPDQGEPAWTVGGSYMVVRPIRMFVERWDRTALGEQEGIIGRSKRTGTPLGIAREEDDPAYPTDPDGARIPLDAHIRLANPRTAATQSNRILRRGYSYSRGFDDAGLLDEGLVFVCFQRDLEKGFVTVQGRLAGEPLEEYIQPVGGGYFFAPPGVAAGGVIGGSLLG